MLFSDPQRLTVSEYLERWLSDTARYQVAASTYGRYERTVRNHFLPFFKRLRLRDVSVVHVRALKARKLEEGIHPNTVGVMPFAGTRCARRSRWPSRRMCCASGRAPRD